MVESGAAYLTSKDGILRGVILISGCIAFALVAAGGFPGAIAWSFAAYLIAWIVTFLIYFFTLVNLISKMDCGVSFEAVDFCISVVLFFFCLSGNIVLAIYLCSFCDLWIAGDIFGFITAILYFVEVYLHQGNAPTPTRYLTTVNGLAKLAVVILGSTAFALLVAGGYRCRCDSGCDSGRQFALAAYVISWSITMIFLLLYVTGLNEKIGGAFAKADFFWAAFSFVFCLVASIVLACYVDDCDRYSSRRVAADVFGFFTTIAYLVEAILLKKSGGESLVAPVK